VQYIIGNDTIKESFDHMHNEYALQTQLTGFVPYIGATETLNLGNYDLYANDMYAQNIESYGAVVADEIQLSGKFYDTDDSAGDSLQVLSSTGTKTKWVDAGGGIVTESDPIYVADSSNRVLYENANRSLNLGNHDLYADSIAINHLYVDIDAYIETLEVGASLSVGDELFDKLGESGTSGQLLSSTSTGINWIDAGGGIDSLVEDTSPQLGGNLDLNDKSLDYTAALGTDHTYVGAIETATVGETVSFGDVLYYKLSDGKWWKADQDTYIETPAMRMCVAATITANNSGTLLIRGKVRDDTWNFTIVRVYLGAIGTATSTVPSTTGTFVQMLGIAITADKLDFNPSIDVGEIQ
jgi:hypothetical protein